MGADRFKEEDLAKLGLIKDSDGKYFKPKTKDLIKNLIRKPSEVDLAYAKARRSPTRWPDIPTEFKEGVIKYDYPPLITFKVDPMGKPRMTQSDKWKKRDVTDRYWELKDHLVKQASAVNFILPECNYHMIFYIGMAKSWPKKKKEEMNMMPHQQKPDKDNLEKAVLDSLCKEDAHIWDGRVSKFWAYKPSLVIYKI